jgi:hypothetical protein
MAGRDQVDGIAQLLAKPLWSKSLLTVGDWLY